MDPLRSDTASDAGAYWFPAKKYGWGWGPPVTWQGWVVTVTWFAILVVGLIVLESRRAGLPWNLVYVLAMSGVLILICYWKGEPPQWRWGDRSS
jgi:hypothetical protein